MQKFAVCLMLSLLLTGCATTELQKQRQIANAPLVNAGLITAKMGLSMTSTDAEKLRQLIFTSPAQLQQTWKSGTTQITYQFTSLNITLNAQGQPCRTYRINRVPNKADQQLQTQACRQDDGSWHAVSATPEAQETV